VWSNSEIEGRAELLRGRLRLLVICLSHSWGGLEQVAANDALEVAHLGFEVRFLVLNGSPLAQFLGKYSEIELVLLDQEPQDLLDLKLKKVLQDEMKAGVSVIHTHQTSILGSIVPWMVSFPHVSLVVSRHIMNNHNKKTLFHRAIYRRVDSFLVMSQALKQNVLETHPMHERKIHVVNLGLDFDRFDPVKVDPRKQRALWGADDQTVVIGVVGRIDPAKCQDVFLKAAAGLVQASYN
jgi:glycosyltransferase involved in cell wall biosynthesis